MSDRFLSETKTEQFRQHLIQNEKSAATVEKYLRDVRAFSVYLRERAVTKETLLEYKRHLQEKRYAVRSINSMLASINSFLEFCTWTDCKVKTIRRQREVFCAEEKEMTKTEYLRLLNIAKKNPKLHLIMQTICGTGI